MTDRKTTTAGGSSGRLLVIGGGYAGVTAANRIRSSLTPTEAERFRVVLVCPRAELVDRLRLHQLAAGTRDEVRIPLSEMLHPGVDRIVATVHRIDPGARTVELGDESGHGRSHLGYHSAVIAVGSDAVGASPDPDWHGVQTWAEAHRLRQVLASLRGDNGRGKPTHITVVGGGATGVELAAELAESGAAERVSLRGASTQLAGVPARGQRRIRELLEALGVRVQTGDRVEPGSLPASEHEVTVWAGSLRVSPLAKDSGIETDPSGRVRVDAFLRVPGRPRLYAAGDAATVEDPPGRHLRMSCASAIPLGGHAASVLLADLRGRRARPLSIGYITRCLSLGRRNGVVVPVFANDRPWGVTLTGRLARWYRGWICEAVLRWPVGEARRPGSSPRVPGPVLARWR